MFDQNMASHQSQDSIIEEMNNFNFDEGIIERTITFDSSSDTENDELELKAEPLSPKIAEDSLHKLESITAKTCCDDNDAEVSINKEIRKENIPLNDTGQIDMQKAEENYQLTNVTGGQLKSKPLSPTTVEETLHKSESITTKTSCDRNDVVVITNKEITRENIQLNDTGQIDMQKSKQNYQLTNVTAEHLKSEPLSPTTADEISLKSESITTNSCCVDNDAEVSINKEMRKENIPLNDTSQIGMQKAKKNDQLTNITSTGVTNVLQSFNSLHCSLPCINESFQHAKVDSSKRNNEDPDLQDSEPKKQKTNFPRTKVTSRREVKKFPGKMDSMKNMHRASEQIAQKPVGEALVNRDDIHQLGIDSGRRTPESEQRIMAALKIVADNLINISPYLNRYVKTNYKLNATEYKIASDAFKNAKLHYFALSYSTVASTILPYTKDPKFMQNFYDLTFQLADQKGIPNTFSKKSLQILCSEMIEWTQMKISQHKKDEMSRMSVINYTSSTNSAQLNASEKLNRTVTSSNTNYTDKNNLHRNFTFMNAPLHGETSDNIGDITLVFPADNINSAIKISYNPALTSQLSIPSQSCTNVNSNITVHNNINAINYPGQPQTHPQPQRYQHCYQPQQPSPKLYNVVQEEVNCNNQQEVQHCMQPLAMPPNVIRQNPLSSIKIANCYQLQPSLETKTCSGSNIPMYESYHSSPSHYPQTDISPHKDLSIGPQQLNQMDQSKTHQRNLTRLNNYPQERSSSRDSGFFSPVQDNYQQDCIVSPSGTTASPPVMPNPPPYSCNPYQQQQLQLQQQHQLQQPLIESPAIMKTSSPVINSCNVCKKPTHLLCLGCLNVHYCGTTCQNMDWSYHSKFCRKT